MVDSQKVSLAEVKKKLNKKNAVIDFFRELGKSINLYKLFRILLPEFFVF